MGSALLTQNTIFQQTIEKCDRIFAQHADWSIIEEIKKAPTQSRLEQSEIGHPCTFAIQIGLVALLRHWGIEPSAVIGHSAGEVGAAHIAGIISLEEALHIIWQHCQIMKKTENNGQMAFIALPLDKISAQMVNYPEKITIAAINSPKSVVLSATNGLEEFLQPFEKKRYFLPYAQNGCRLPQSTSHATHKGIWKSISQHNGRFTKNTNLFNTPWYARQEKRF